MLSRLLHQLFGARASREPERATFDAEALLASGQSLRAQGLVSEARLAFEQAAAADPGSALVRMYLGNLDHEAGRMDDAVEHYRAAIERDPANAAAHYNLGLTLTRLGAAAEAVEAFRSCLALAPDYVDARSSLLYALNMSDRAGIAEIAAEHFEWGRRVADPLYVERVYANTPDPERRLRIGYVSADFFQHAAAPFIHTFLAQHDVDRYQVYCYVNAAIAAANAGRYGHTWRDVRSLGDVQLADLIAQDAIDLLVDLSGHTYGTRLLAFARKPAPLQLTFLGYPNTTGMRAMDYRLTDAYTDPPGESESRYREELLRMPHSVWCFRPHEEGVPEVGEQPMLRNGYVRFASLNNASKLNTDLFKIWAEILRRVSDARLVMATIAPGRTRERIAQTFADLGVDPQRIEFKERMSRRDYLAMHNEVDLALDAFPCNGGATTCEALWQGVPVVSLAGDSFESRAGLSLLSSAGMAQLVAHSREEYVDIACALATDQARLQQLRAGLRGVLRTSPLMDAPAFTRALEAHYRAVWRAWCADNLR